MHISVSKDVVGFKSIEIDNVLELSQIIQHFNWSAGTFKDGYRTKDNFLSADCIGLDIDEGCTLDEAKVLFKDYQHIISPSKSHQIEKNGIICDRFRVILFFSQPITNAQVFENTWHDLHTKFPFIDKACKDASRFYYPSQEASSVNTVGTLIEPIFASNIPIERIELTSELMEARLSRSTLDFLVKGAPRGAWNAALFKASKDWYEQGLDKEEFIQKAGSITGDLDSVDLRTIESAFGREPKYLPRATVENLEREALAEDLIYQPSQFYSEIINFLNDKDQVYGLATGIEGLDELLGGGKRLGEITAITATAKAGKSALTHFMIHKWLKRGIPVGFASREMNPATEVVPNLLSLSFHQNIWKAEITAELETQVKAEIKEWPLYFTKGYGYLSLEEFESWALKLISMGVKHFVLDHLHYAMANPEDFKEVSLFMRGIKKFVNEQQIHLDLIIQPRNLGDGEKVSMRSLRGGANIAQAISTLLTMERMPDSKNVIKLSLEVGRSRLCKQGSIYLQYDSETTAFVEGEFEIAKVEPEYLFKDTDITNLFDSKRVKF